ncbi:MAG TPA: PAS domain S-box protein, partial [Nitrosomonas sp.]|nr:PAS domain S-box protein [Nitrosomonas sp.]
MMDSIANLSFSSLLDAFSDPLLLIDNHGIIQQTNLATQNIAGYTNDQLQGKSIDQLIPGWYDTIHLYSQRTALKPLGNRSLESSRTKLIKQNKQALLIDIFPKSIEIDHQRFILLTLHAANSQHQAEHNLQESEERLFLAKQAAGLGIFDLDLQQQIIYQDERMRELWGGKASKISPYDAFYAAIHPKDRISYQIALEKATNPSGDGEFNIDVRVIHSTNGLERWIHSIGKVHFYEGVATRLIGIVQDITQQKLLEKELQSYRAEVESLFKQQVAIQTASAIAHELNQPLTVISAYSELALITLENNPANLDKIKQSLHNCVIQSQRAGDTLRELIASLQKTDAHIERLDLNQVILDALRTVRSDGFSDFQQILQFELNLPAVLANRVQIKKVVV